MSSVHKVMRKKAKQLELKESQKNKINPERVPTLDELLHDVYVSCLPSETDYYNRKDLVRIFSEIAKEIYGKSDDIPVVEEFGSFLMNIFSAKSDLDLSVNFRDSTVDFPRDKKIQTLRKFAKKFHALQRKGHVSGVQPILTARVPVLKVVDCGTGIECDISIENKDGIVKSHIVRMISSIDERFRMLSFLMKAWAKAHDINSSKERTLNSLSIISLVAFHLQTRHPPILPPFVAIIKDGTDPPQVEKNIIKYLNYGKRNKETLGQLFVSLLIKLASVETLWPEGLCASTYRGCWIAKTWNSKFGHITVEDFTDRSQNIARAVDSTGLIKIYECIHLSIKNVCAFVNGKIERTELRRFLFGGELRPAGVDKCTTNVYKRKEEPHESLDPTQTKRMRLNRCSGQTSTEGWGRTPTEDFVETPTVVFGRTPTQGWSGAPRVNLGSTPTEGWGGNPALNLGRALTEAWCRSPVIWGRTPAQAWGGTPIIGQGRIPAEGVGRTPTENWGRTPTEGWGGTPRVGWRGTPTEVLGGTPPVNWGRTPEGLSGTPTVGWGRTPGGCVGATPTENLGRTPAEGWGGTFGVGLGRIPTKGLAATPTENWGRPPTEGSGGAPTVGFGRTFTEGWVGSPTLGWGLLIQRAVVPDYIRRNDTQSAEVNHLSRIHIDPPFTSDNPYASLRAPSSSFANPNWY